MTTRFLSKSKKPERMGSCDGRLNPMLCFFLIMVLSGQSKFGVRVLAYSSWFVFYVILAKYELHQPIRNLYFRFRGRNLLSSLKFFGHAQ